MIYSERRQMRWSPMLRIADRRFAVLAAVATGLAYYLGAKVGTAFTP